MKSKRPPYPKRRYPYRSIYHESVDLRSCPTCGAAKGVPCRPRGQKAGPFGETHASRAKGANSAITPFLRRLANTLNAEFGPPFLPEGVVHACVTDANVCNLRIGRRDVDISPDGSCSGGGTALAGPRAKSIVAVPTKNTVPRKKT